MAKALAKGSRITGAQREQLRSQFVKRYLAGESIRKIVVESGRSYGFVHGILKESGSTLRGRGGGTRGVQTSGSAKQARGTTTSKVAAKKAVTKKAAESRATTASAKKAPATKRIGAKETPA